MLKEMPSLQRFKSKSIFIKLLLSYLGTAILSILIITLLVTYWVKKESTEYINSTTGLALSNISTLSSGLFETANKISYEVYNNINVRNLLLFPDKDEYAKFYIAKNIETITVSNPYIFSVYICDSKSIVFKTIQKIGYDESYETISKLAEESPLLYPIPRKLKNEKGEIAYVYSIVYHQSYVGDQNLDASVVININASSLYNQVYTNFVTPEQNLLITDRSGNIVLHKNIGLLSTNIAREGYFQTAIKSGKNSGFFYGNVDNAKYVYNYVLSSDKKFMVFSISEYKSFFSKTTQIRNTIIYACIIVLLLIIVLSVFLSYRLYTPINNIFFNIRTLFKNAPVSESQLSEFKYVSQAITGLVTRLNSLEKDSEDKFQIMRNNYVKNLLTSIGSEHDTDLEDNIRKYKVMKSNCSYYLIVLRLDDTKEFLNSNTKEAIDFQFSSIGNIACECLKPSFDSSYYMIDNEHIVIISHPAEENDEIGNYSQIIHSMSYCQETVHHLLNLKITVGVSNVSKTLSEIGQKYSEAYNYTNYRLVYGKQTLYGSHNIKISASKNDRIGSLLDTAIYSVKNNSMEQFCSAIYELFSSLKGNSYERIIKVFFQLANSIVQMPMELHSGYEDNSENNIQDIYKQLKSFEDYTELEKWFKELFIKTGNILSSIKNKKTPDMIEYVIRYINDNYSEYNLSANVMAEKLSITPQYFSKIFNEHIGGSFPDYVNNIRLEKAKELLLSNPKLNISEICDMVGYNNRTYFTSSFTKKYGLSPAKYKTVQGIKD